jgi:CDP-diacylglycerol--glycerol-3-phosphate 3-phosphatidyltransferase
MGRLAISCRLMTLPNKITVTRICLIPVFALVAWMYGVTVANNHPDERLRRASAGIFILAAATDGLDGFIARRFNQRSRLGSILDPIADKGLIATAILVIVLGNWPNGFPVWFAVTVLGRDLLLGIGFLTLSNAIGDFTVRPSLLGKTATALQITAILWVLLGVQWIAPIYAIAVAMIFTLISGFGYIFDAFRQTQSAGRRRL